VFIRADLESRAAMRVYEKRSRVHKESTHRSTSQSPGDVSESNNVGRHRHGIHSVSICSPALLVRVPCYTKCSRLDLDANAVTRIAGIELPNPPSTLPTLDAPHPSWALCDDRNVWRCEAHSPTVKSGESDSEFRVIHPSMARAPTRNTSARLD
jgi:hypothetical protein